MATFRFFSKALIVVCVVVLATLPTHCFSRSLNLKRFEVLTASYSSGGGGGGSAPSPAGGGGSPGGGSPGGGGSPSGGGGHPGMPSGGGSPGGGGSPSGGGGHPGMPSGGGSPGGGGSPSGGGGHPGMPSGGGSPGGGSPGKPSGGGNSNGGKPGGQPGGQPSLGHLSANQQAQCNDFGKQAASLQQQCRDLSAQGKAGTPEFKAKTDQIQNLKSNIKSIAGSNFDVDSFIGSGFGGGNASGGPPSSPTNSGSPKAPGTPSSPKVSGTPNSPSPLGSPNSPSASPLGSPSSPTNSGTPKASGTPSSPKVSGTPNSTSPFGSPNSPSTSGTPSPAGSPNSPSTSGTPSPAGSPSSVSTSGPTSSSPITSGSPSNIAGASPSGSVSPSVSNGSVSSGSSNGGSRKISVSDFSSLDVQKQSEAKDFGKKLVSKQMELNKIDKNDKEYGSKSDSIQDDINNIKTQLQSVIGVDVDTSDFVSTFVDSSFSNLVSNNLNVSRTASRKKMSPSQFASLDAGKQSQAKKIGKKIVSKQMELNQLDKSVENFNDKSESLMREINDSKNQLQIIIGVNVDIRQFIINFVDSSFSSLVPNDSNDFNSNWPSSNGAQNGTTPQGSTNLDSSQSGTSPQGSANADGTQNGTTPLGSANPDGTQNGTTPQGSTNPDGSQSGTTPQGSANPDGTQNGTTPLGSANPDTSFSDRNVRNDLIPTNEAIKRKVAEFAKMNEQADEAAASSLLDTAKCTDDEKKSALLIRSNFKSSAWTALQFELKSDFVSTEYQQARDAAFLAMDSFKNLMRNLVAGAVDLNDGSDAARDAKMFMLSSLASMLSLIQ